MNYVFQVLVQFKIMNISSQSTIYFAIITAVPKRPRHTPIVPYYIYSKHNNKLCISNTKHDCSRDDNLPENHIII